MKTLKVIKSIIGLAAILMIVGIVIAMVVIVTVQDGEYIVIGEPHLELTTDTLGSSINDYLPKLDGKALIKAEKLDLELSALVGLQLKIVIIVLVLAVSIYIGIIIELTRKIILDIEQNAPFTFSNIKRVKLIGILVAFSPVFEWLLHTSFARFLLSYLSFTDLVLYYESGLGWPVFLLGLLIMALGVAFEQGKKIQEENELTI